MIKTKRSIVLHGPSTLTISLPSRWVKQYDLKKGDELTVKEEGTALKIYPEEIKSAENKRVIDVGAEERVGRSSITGSYRRGYDSLEITFNNPDYIKSIQSLIARELMGFEIIKHNENSCTIKDLAGHSRDEFDAVHRRIWLLLLDIAEETVRAVERKDKEALERMEIKDNLINKLTNYCIRHLIKQGHTNQKNTTLYYHAIRSLEEIADHYKDMCSMLIKEINEIKIEDIKIIKEVNRELQEFYNIWYTYKKEPMEILFKQLKETIRKINEKRNKVPYMHATATKIRDLLSVAIELNL